MLLRVAALLVLLLVALIGWLLLTADGAQRWVGGEELAESQEAERQAAPLGMVAEAADGRVELEDEEAAPVPDLLPGAEEPRFPDAELATLVVTLRSADTGFPVAGETITFLPDGAGETYERAIQYMVQQGWGWEHRLPERIGFAARRDAFRTDAEGRVRVRLPAGLVYAVHTARDSRFEKVWKETPALAASSETELTLLMRTEPDLLFFGRVVDKATGAAIAGARIAEHYQQAAAVLELTDAHGGFAVLARSWNPRSLWVLAEGYGPAAFVPTTGNATADDAFVLRLTRAAVLEGRVTGVPEGGAPAMLRWRSVDRDLNQSTRWEFDAGRYEREVQVDADGGYRVEGLPADLPLQVTIDLPDRTRLELGEEPALEPGERRRRDYAVGRLAVLNGLVVDQMGAPVPEAAVVARPANQWELVRGQDVLSLSTDWSGNTHEATCDEGGRFTLDDVAPGDWVVGVTPVRPDALTEVTPTGRLVTVGEGGGAHEVTIQVHRGLYLSGVVLDPSGQPVAGAQITAQLEDPLSFRQGRSEVGGHFQVGALWPGEYTIQAWPSRRVANSVGMGPSEPLQVAAGREELVLRLLPGGVLRGRIVSGDGSQSPTMWVSVMHRGSNRSTGVQAASGEEFEVRGLEAGNYDVVAWAREGWAGYAADFPVPAGGESAELLLQVGRAAVLSVRVPDGEPRMRCDVLQGEVSLHRSGLEGGPAQRFIVPPGRCEIVASRGGVELARKVVTVAAREELEIALLDD